MIDCSEYRQQLLTDPRAQGEDLRAHRDSCAECTRFGGRLALFEERLGRALRLNIDSQPVQEIRRRRARPRWFAMAASVVLAAVVAGALWLAVPGQSLADAVVAHMAGEPQAWQRTDVPAPAQRLAAVLRDAHLRLAPGAGTVSYANSCEFRGHRVPHLVVQSAAGPVTVMVLVHESVAQRQRFDEQGYRGVIVPVPGHGSIAVLAPDASDSVDRVAAQVLAAVHWTG